MIAIASKITLDDRALGIANSEKKRLIQVYLKRRCPPSKRRLGSFESWMQIMGCNVIKKEQLSYRLSTGTDSRRHID